MKNEIINRIEFAQGHAQELDMLFAAFKEAIICLEYLVDEESNIDAEAALNNIEKILGVTIEDKMRNE